MLSVGNSPDGLSGVGALRKRSIGGGVKILLDECVPRQLDLRSSALNKRFASHSSCGCRDSVGRGLDSAWGI